MMPCVRILMVAIALLSGAARPIAQNAPTAALRIVVVEGEDAVNIIQQKTAVAPIVEVRDRNDQPVAGAVVTFSVRGGRLASFPGGAQTLSVTTNAAGRAAAAAVNPLAGGAFQIEVQAAFQGQTAAAAIAQTNVLTAAEAAAGTGSGAATGASGAAGGSTGGGLSATTIGVVGAGVAGGVVAATQLTGGGEGAEQGRGYSGPYDMQFVITVTNPDGSNPCTFVMTYVGTLRMRVTDQGGAIGGSAEMQGTKSVLSTTCGGQPPTGTFFTGTDGDLPLTGTPAALRFDRSSTFAGRNNIAVTETLSFSGAVGQDSIAGTLSVSRREVSPTRVGTGSASQQVTLR